MGSVCSGKVMDVLFSAQIGGTAVLPRKVDLEAIPQIGGQSIFEYDIDADKPWRTPGKKLWVKLLGTWWFMHGHCKDALYALSVLCDGHY